MNLGLVCAILVSLVLPSLGQSNSVPAKVAVPEPSATGAGSVGAKSCARCHSKEYALWVGSHHDLAMGAASEKTVLGDFNDTEFTHFGLASRFFKRDDKFMVRTDGPDGELHDYEVKYTFGAYPLQQYLIEFPGGRYQALSIAWDSRPKGEGGQRWFHLYPNERIAHSDVLHWTSLNQNWNSMCAECHSTNLEKNYDAATHRYQTTWSEINVSCEACHGPASAHVSWAERKPGWEDSNGDRGLLVGLNKHTGNEWVIDAAGGNPRLKTPRRSDDEIELCGRCHSRRSTLAETFPQRGSLLDTHMPRLLDEGFYHPDGQIQEEVYVYGSFLQSKMYHAGVSCSDCHEPHSLKLRAPGNAVCTSCHLSAKFDTTGHHHHKVDSAGAKCVSCHMPVKTYMVVDPRHDHSLRIPRPDLSVKLGTPNACNSCHGTFRAEWAAEKVREWYGQPAQGFQDYAEVLHAGRDGAPAAGQQLAGLVEDKKVPAIARATALSLLQPYLSPALLHVIKAGLQDSDPLVRVAAIRALRTAPLAIRLELGFPLLKDPVRAVRVEAARLLAPVREQNLTADQRSVLDQAFKEYEATQDINADRPESHLNLGSFYAERGQLAKAETAYKKAIEIQPSFTPAYVNIADLYRVKGKDDDGAGWLRKALAVNPDDAEARYALGLLGVRQKRLPEALAQFERAARLRPDNPRYSYVYAVALNSAGKATEAINVLEKAYQRHPRNREILSGLVAFHRETGNLSAAKKYAAKLAAPPAKRH